MYRNPAIRILAMLVVPACGKSVTEPATSICATRNGAEVCAAKAQYSPGDLVRFTVRNTSGASIYKDNCSAKLVGTTTRDGKFEAVFDPTRSCGPNASMDDIVANMIELAPDESTSDSLELQTFAFQGYYRVIVWIVDSDGTLVANTPAISGTFHVFPSAK